jgi:CRISPR/Cas system-associated endonuclease/helicase Cas3
MRMIHTLPTRSLVNQLETRMQGYVGRLAGGKSGEIRVAAMHGQRPQTALFYADAVFATLDQVVSSYACAPLSLSVRQGNIPAGAVPGSLLVFDEVHTFEPELGLQSVLVLAARAVRMRVPFVIMSATLPDRFVIVLAERLGTTLIEAQGDHIAGRKKRTVTLHLCAASPRIGFVDTQPTAHPTAGINAVVPGTLTVLGGVSDACADTAAQRNRRALMPHPTANAWRV